MIKSIFVPTLSTEWPFIRHADCCAGIFLFLILSFFLALPRFSQSKLSRIATIIHSPPPHPPSLLAFLARSPPFFSFAPCFDSGCASLGGEDGVPQTLEGYWSRRNTVLCFSARRHCERGLIVRVKPQKERTKGHSGSLWRSNMKGGPTFNED